jgi:hypothetical protein
MCEVLFTQCLPNKWKNACCPFAVATKSEVTTLAYLSQPDGSYCLLVSDAYTKPFFSSIFFLFFYITPPTTLDILSTQLKHTIAPLFQPTNNRTQNTNHRQHV